MSAIPDPRRFDAIVLGAGIAGVSAAYHLHKRHRSVLLVDRSEPGEATSYGNSGVIEREGFFPILFPRRFSELMRYARNEEAALHFHRRFLPRVAPFLWQLRAASTPARVAQYGEAMDPLLSHAAAEHGQIAAKARAVELFRGTGWLRGWRSRDLFDAQATPLMEACDRFSVRYEVLDGQEITDLEPDLSPVFARALLIPETVSVSSPGAVTKAYARLYEVMGGAFSFGDARTLRYEKELWRVELEGGAAAAPDVVIALGPWSMDVLRPLGYRLPFAVKRGYHQHFRPRGDAALERPVVDMAYGYVLTPMKQGYRITTGIEFANRDAPPSPVQIARVLPQARALFPLGEAVEKEPWMGARPCFPDSMPVVGPAPNHPGLWFDFGHGHLGFTLGPATGRLIAELITREMPFVDPSPFSATRF